MKLSEMLLNGSAKKDEKGNIAITTNETALIVDVEVIGGLYCSLNQLTSLEINQPIGGSLNCSYNRLTSLEINQPIGRLNCSYNRLTSLEINQPIGGWLDCGLNQLIETPKYNRLKDGNKGENWIYVDGMLSHFSHIRHLKGVTFYIGFKYTVAEQNGKYAHGKDMKSALIDLRFKLADRDESDYEDLTLDSKLSYDDAIVMYRVITGACQAGTQAFLEQHPEINARRKFAVKEILDLTDGEYGNNSIKNFFMKDEK